MSLLPWTTLHSDSEQLVNESGAQPKVFHEKKKSVSGHSTCPEHFFWPFLNFECNFVVGEIFNDTPSVVDSQ